MSYEIDFIGVSKNECTQDADAICMRWKKGKDNWGNDRYIVGVVDGGFEAHGKAMVNHMNKYYFNDKDGNKSVNEKTIDFVVVTHPDQDHTIGLKRVLENFNVKMIYMNLPWLYIDNFWDKVKDGRITKDSLEKRLKEKYKTIADIEEIANDRNIPIQSVFQGEIIEDNLLILSPSKDFYLDLLVESGKTPMLENAELRNDGLITTIVNKVTGFIFNLFENWDVETLHEGVKTSAENDSSVVIRGIIDGSGFLLTGDAGVRALNKAIDYMDYRGENVIEEISFYQIPHHGGRHNVSPSLLNRMIGNKVEKDSPTVKTAFASVAEGSDHPLKMVTNAYIRRGVKTYKTSGNVIYHHNGEMPERGWIKLTNIEFSNYVEEWDD